MSYIKGVITMIEILIGIIYCVIVFIILNYVSKKNIRSNILIIILMIFSIVVACLLYMHKTSVISGEIIKIIFLAYLFFLFEKIKIKKT